MAKLKLSPPWIIYYEEVNAMFAKDSEVHVIYDEDECSLKLYVNNCQKAYALSKVLPETKEFGNIKMTISVILANEKESKGFTIRDYPNANPWETVFSHNMAVQYVKPVMWIGGEVFTYVVFKKEVVQYYTDNIGDLDGMASTLYETIAKDIFVNTDGTFFCTSTGYPEVNCRF